MRTLYAWGTAAGLCLAVACGGGGDRSETTEREGGVLETDEAGVRPAPIVETGCLSASGDRYVLTQLQRAGSATAVKPTTEAYQLVGNEDDLRAHLGREVRVTGEAEAAQVVEVREATPGQATGTTGDQRAAGARPDVSTETQTRFETRRLRVSSVTPTGANCVPNLEPSPQNN